MCQPPSSYCCWRLVNKALSLLCSLRRPDSVMLVSPGFQLYAMRSLFSCAGQRVKLVLLGFHAAAES